MAKPRINSFVILGGTFVFALILLVVFRTRVATGGLAQQPRGRLDYAVPAGDRQALLSGLFHGALANVTDGEDFKQPPNYFRVLDHVLSMPEDQFSARVTGALNWKDSVEHPERWRGEFVRVRGQLVHLTAVKLQEPVQNLGDVWRGFVGQPDLAPEGSPDVVAFDLVVPPPIVNSDGRNGDVVDVEGIVYRTVSYEGKPDPETGKPSPVRTVPYLVARKLTVHVNAASARDPWIYTAARAGAVIVITLVAVLLFMRWSNRRGRPPARRPGEPAGFRQMFEDAQRRDAQQNAVSGPGNPAKPGQPG